MPTQKKIDQVAELKDVLERAAMVITTGYRGLNVKEQITLRRALTDGKIEVRVVKNSLLKLAAEGSDRAELMEVVDGPTALAIVYDEIVEAAKAITEYKKGAPAAFTIQGGYMDGTVLSENDVEALTKIPPKPVLIAQIAGSLQSPLAELVALLDSPLRELTSLLNSLLTELPGLIEARVRQLEENPELAPAAEAPAEEAPAEEPAEASAEEAPAEEPAETSAEEAPAEEPAEEAAGEAQAPAEEAAGEAPAEAPAEEAAEEAPAEEPAEEAAEEAPPEEPAEEAAEEAPAEESAEEAAEEAPAEEPAGEAEEESKE
jgi:large subunit ribosomal protein L10